ncbi:AMP-binding protein [Sneathiella glossodoripedis]|uniref:AMP-binding protein n=1 Tax=Sneathiella glossodoripedis TaxID=418853 RepID=UPI00047197BA|nr:AMP-binding protein [Sneathiella glossodoripedis]
MQSKRFLSLQNIWNSALEDSAAIVHEDGSCISRRDLFALASQLSGYVKGKTVAVFCQSTKYETVALLAAMRWAHKIVLPSNAQPKALEEIQGCFDILLTDLKISGIPSLNLEKVLDKGLQEYRTIDLSGEVDLNKKMVFFTSGSSGKPKEVPKYLYQLDNEVREWESLIGEEAENAEVHATVGHQHIYGLLFRILWPLCTKRVFADQICQNWDEVIKTTSRCQTYILFSSPTHLCRLDALAASNTQLKPIFVFSSGGILPPDDAKKASELLGTAVQEIYGSTETGGIARRFSNGGNGKWHPLPTVNIQLDDRGCLSVSSQFLEMDRPNFQTEDLAIIDENGLFSLGGRADRIVKIEGKRVSLPRIEELLRKHEWVQDVHVRALEGPPAILGAAIELNEVGKHEINSVGSFRIGRSLKRYLAEFEDAVVAPRRWKFLKQLPRNAQGKLSAYEMEQVFKSEPEKARKIVFDIIDKECSEDFIRTLFVAPADLEYFKGHFTEEPILPGVVQIHWAVRQAQEEFNMSGSPKFVEKLKFKQFIFPEVQTILELKKMKQDQVSFRYLSEQTDGKNVEHSSGVLKFEEFAS